MKNTLLLFAMLIALSVSFSSCYKSYDCVCKDTWGTETKHIVNGTNKQEARTNCDKLDLQGNCELQ